MQKLEDAKTTEIVMGAQAPGSTQYDYPVLLNRLFGYKFKVITGYESTPKIHLAMERGEVQGTIANWSTLKAIGSDWLADKKVRIIVAMGAAEECRDRRRAADPRHRQERRRQAGAAARDCAA